MSMLALLRIDVVSFSKPDCYKSRHLRASLNTTYVNSFVVTILFGVLVLVFVVPGKAASFRLEVFELFAAKHGVNAMPASIYKKQGSDTFTWHSDIARKRPRI